jgi:hypothetical protein
METLGSDAEKQNILNQFVFKAVYGILFGHALLYSDNISEDEAFNYYEKTDIASLQLAVDLVLGGEDGRDLITTLKNTIFVSQMFDDLKDIQTDEGIKVNIARIYLQKYDPEALQLVLSGQKRFQDTLAWPEFSKKVEELARGNPLFKVFGTNALFFFQNSITDTDRPIMRTFHALIFPSSRV